MPHFCLICLSQKWLLVHLSLSELQTPAMVHSPEGGSFSRMQSSANSGKSKSDICPSDSLRLSSFELQIPCFIVICGIELNPEKPPKISFLVVLLMGVKDNSFQKHSGRNLTSLIPGGSGLRGRDFKKRRNERLVTKKKSIYREREMLGRIKGAQRQC